ncbi:nuclear transport factor 2 family protein [Rhodanobacter sp. B2A1Ga4]|uniref:YybH family protein n=1 Tax=Rhodanobacter sp. B2A1Ga4 TaxID=2778647 RepID=UPI001B388A1F|nr:nuclear transport factor 2 family protein [Rhodanobacter sp. B2A1Ga4]MBQ4853917.1 nuclear transport factor 2 family protein [Rhodanobacter sp. B2A1Ga4]
MNGQRFFLLCGLLVVMAGWAVAVPARAGGEEAAAIRQVMAQQAAAWNRGDVANYMRGYKDAPDTTFVGSKVRKGYRTILDGYRKHYATAQQMGRLTFSELDVRLLPGTDGEVRYAAVTGRFHLDRAAHGEVAQDDGVFSLLWEKTADGWKIILDHTS